MVEGARLEIVWARKRLGSSNLPASATFLTKCLKKRDSYFVSLNANPLASAIYPVGVFFCYDITDLGLLNWSGPWHEFVLQFCIAEKY